MILDFKRILKCQTKGGIAQLGLSFGSNTFIQAGTKSYPFLDLQHFEPPSNLHYKMGGLKATTKRVFIGHFVVTPFSEKPETPLQLKWGGKGLLKQDFGWVLIPWMADRQFSRGRNYEEFVFFCAVKKTHTQVL